MKRQSALVVFSGGQDSTTCLFWAKEHYETVEAVTFAYGQRHHLEIQVAREIAKEQGIRHHILDMSLLEYSIYSLAYFLKNGKGQEKRDQRKYLVSRLISSIQQRWP